MDVVSPQPASCVLDSRTNILLSALNCALRDPTAPRRRVAERTERRVVSCPWAVRQAKLRPLFAAQHRSCSVARSKRHPRLSSRLPLRGQLCPWLMEETQALTVRSSRWGESRSAWSRAQVLLRRCSLCRSRLAQPPGCVQRRCATCLRCTPARQTRCLLSSKSTDWTRRQWKRRWQRRLWKRPCLLQSGDELESVSLPRV